MIWRTAIPYILIAGIAATSCAIVVKEAYASPARLTAMKSMEGWHEVRHRKAIQARIGVNPVRTPWCGYALAYAVKKAGQKPVRGYPSAKAWLRFGRGVSLSQARKGDIVVIRTRHGYHVTIFSHRSKGRVCGVGGNQSNSVKISCYLAGSVKGVRR